MSNHHERLLELATVAHGNAEVFGVTSERRHVEFESNRPKNIGLNQSFGIALRTINSKGKIGFSSTSDTDKIDDLVGRVSALSDYGAEAKFEFPSSSEYQSVESYDAATSDVTDEAMLDFGREAIDAVLSEFPEALCSVDLSRTTGHQRLLNSSGVDAKHSYTACGFMMAVELIRGTDMLSVWDGTVSTAPIGDPDVARIVGVLLTKLRNSEKIVDAPSSDDIQVVFSPVGFNSTFIPPLVSGFNGKNVAAGSSPLIDRWGEKMLDERISISDDPLRPMTPATRSTDDEGIPARRINLVDNGVIGEPYLDLQTAGETGMPSSGSGMRSVATTPSPSLSFLSMAGGNASSEEILGSVENGILVEQLLGAGQGNELGGDFRANLSLGFLIENGEVVGRVKDTMISGNVYDALNQVEAIGETPELVWGTRSIPWVRTRGVEVATSS